MDEDGANEVATFWSNLGAEPVIMDAEEHDQLVAATSHLPHMAAVAIVQAVAHGDDLKAISELCGTGFQDTTRVANGSAAVWRDIVQTNADPVNARLKLLRDRIDDMIGLIERKEFEELADVLSRATATRNHLLKRDHV
jgi:prephenate dehydrogenase